MCTGCWDYREINKLSVVLGMAIDKTEDGKYSITVEIVDAEADSGKESSTKSRLFVVTGETVFDTLRNAIKINSPKLYFGHLEIVIIGREVDNESIIQLLDLLVRDVEPRLNIDLLISRENTAKEILTSKSVSSEINSFDISDMLENQKDLGKTIPVQVYQYINSLYCEGICPVIPSIYLVETGGVITSEISGVAMLKKAKLIGFLEEEDTRYFCFIRNKVKGGLLNFKSSPEKDKPDTSLEIFSNKTKIKPVYSGGKISMDIEIKTEAAIGERSVSEEFDPKEDLLKIKSTAEKSLEQYITNVIKKVQKEFGEDIFGFGMAVNNELPEVWKKVEGEWDTIFKNIDVNIKATIEIRNKGMMKKPILSEE